MEQTLSMNLSQKLAMTMQMQQAIQLLQMSAQELRAAVEKEYLENPVLEMDESSNGDAPKEEVRAEDISPMADYLENGQPGYFTDDRDGGMEAATPSGPTLEEELLEQVRYAFFDEEERAVAIFIVGSIDERGYLIVPVEEIMRAMGASEDKVMEVLRRVQEFEPPGIGARDLQECLRIQARQRGIYEGLVAALIDRHLDEVAASRVKSIAEAEQASPVDVQLAIDILRTLDPKPGRAYGLASSHYVQPDVFVRKVDGDYVVSISERSMP
ncbi:MAG: RNA polymerase sigma-54 factor, partial [Selenomonadaceae bacterium]|nr:RNA polymerase sigma-54 factor [Selenomonadaceae bacterium]